MLGALHKVTGDGELVFPRWKPGRVMERLTRNLGFQVRMHDIRRTGATMAAEHLDTDLIVISAILNHTLPGPAATMIYNRASYYQQKAKALQRWADYLDKVVSEEKAKVVNVSEGQSAFPMAAERAAPIRGLIKSQVTPSVCSWQTAPASLSLSNLIIEVEPD
jgi:hypothetical protein